MPRTGWTRIEIRRMGCYAADILAAGKTNRVVGYRNGQFVDYDIEEALSMQKDLDPYTVEVSNMI